MNIIQLISNLLDYDTIKSELEQWQSLRLPVLNQLIFLRGGEGRGMKNLQE